MDRLEAIAARMRVEEDEFLLAVRQIVRIVDVEHNAARHVRKASAEHIDHPDRHARKRAPGRRVFQTRQCWLGHEIGGIAPAFVEICSAGITG